MSQGGGSLKYYEYYYEPSFYFRVDDGGVFKRWNAKTRHWVEVRNDKGRDFLSRAIENGDGAWPLTDEECAAVWKEAEL